MWMWIGSPGGSRLPPSRHLRCNGGADRGVRGGASGAPCGGFTLLEVLVAFTVLALIMTVLLRIFSDGFRGMTAAEVHAAAALHAQATLASVGAEIPLAPGEWSGTYDDGFRWQVRVEPYEEAGMIVPPRAFIAYRVIAAVDGRRSGGVTLSSLRLAGAGLDQPVEDADVPQ